MFETFTSVLPADEALHCIFIYFALKILEFTRKGICLGIIKKTSVEVALMNKFIKLFALMEFSAAKSDTLQATTIPVGLASYVRIC